MSGVKAVATDVVETWSDVTENSVAPLIVRRSLERFLDDIGVGDGEVVIAPIGDGHSNVTMELRRAEARLVLRRPPRPPFALSAHDVVREARLLRVLAAEGARVPRVVAICEQPDVIGAPFYVMEHIEGHVISSSLPAAFDSHPARRALGEELVDALVEIHAIDVRKGPASTLGRPTGYLDRQLRRFASIWDEQRTRDLPELLRAEQWLAEHRPDSSELCVVHGDYRLGNAIVAPGTPGTPVRLVAVLDWEMATLGDPMADLGYLCATWAEPGDSDNPMLALSAATRRDGFARRADLIQHYVHSTGRDVEGLAWYEVLALWKCAIFLEASYRRYCEKRTDDPYFAALGEGVPLLARAAVRRMESG